MSDEFFLKIDNMSFQDVESETDFIPLMTAEDEEVMNNQPLEEEVAILPLRNTVLYPGVVIPITAGRDKSIKLINDANNAGKNIGVVAQIDEKVEEPSGADVYSVGTIAQIVRILKMPDGNTMVILQGKKRFEIDQITTTKPYLRAKIKEINEERPAKNDKEFKTIVDSIKELAIKLIKENPNIPTEATFAIQNIHSAPFLISFVSSNLNISVKEKQALLSVTNLKDRALETLRYMNIEMQELELKNNIQSKVRSDLDQQQREYFLHQQMKTIQEELGGVSYEADVEEMKKKASKKIWVDAVKNHFDKELGKLVRTNPNSPDYGVQRNYLETFLELPWSNYSKDNFDLKRAQKILDREHFGLDDVKERIIEHLAVLKLRNDMKSPIICLYGPPGVGKTSIGKSIAEALGREYVRISLGGMRDEAEIRGHRKTYIGAMPGRILQSLKKAGTSNPVFVLDEIDKLSTSYNGDPSSALLEVLDPEQNSEFHDNFLEIGYDLSKVMFVATSNSMNTIQAPLKDRMEIINMTGYTLEEKVEIAKQHLLPKQIKEHGLTTKDIVIGKKQLEKIVSGYTRESGVRSLEKKIAQMVRYVAKCKAMDEPYNTKISDKDIIKVLKAPRLERDKYENNETAGVVTGLAWTSVGGDILFIESILSKGKGILTTTGNLGNVMKESVTIAMEYIKSNAAELNINNDILDKYNVHIHVPEGATPKDGPSAGIAMLTSLVSSFTQKRVKKNLAMTGEITLRGKVLPVGGIKEKILAAKRADIKEIILCKENKLDIDEIKPEYIEGIAFHFVETMKEVIEIAITNQKVKNAKEFS